MWKGPNGQVKDLFYFYLTPPIIVQSWLSQKYKTTKILFGFRFQAYTKKAN